MMIEESTYFRYQKVKKVDVEINMEQKKKSLLELMDIELKLLGLPLKYTSVSDFIYDDESSASFIREMLKDEDFRTPEEASDIYDFAKTRARHSAITFLMGLVFKKFSVSFFEHGETAEATRDTGNKRYGELLRSWLITSLYHDKAYYSEHLKNGKLDYRKTFKYFLLTDEYADDRLACVANFSNRYPKVLAHTYDHILSYDSYARNYHANKIDGAEKVDHGILGGIMVFNDLVRKSLRTTKFDGELPMIKACCLTIAQHNIFKSGSAASDQLYPSDLSYLHHDSDFRIGKGTPLLLFLCLVDTLECVKRFSKGENEKTSLQTKTVLSSIFVTVTEDEIKIDYSQLHKKIDDKGNSDFHNTYKRYLNGLLSLNEWTSFEAVANDVNPDVISISLAKDATFLTENQEAVPVGANK